MGPREREVLSRQAVPESWHRGPNHGSNVGPLPPGCDFAPTEGRGHSGGDERYHRRVRTRDRGDDRREYHDHDRARETAWNPRRAGIAHAALRLLLQADKAPEVAGKNR